MPRKLTTFAEKVKKESQVHYCPKCGGAIEHIVTVDAEKSSSGSWKFRQRNVGVCKCNHDQVYK
jgi:ribosomal protein L34E